MGSGNGEGLRWPKHKPEQHKFARKVLMGTVEMLRSAGAPLELLTVVIDGVSRELDKRADIERAAHARAQLVESLRAQDERIRKLKQEGSITLEDE